MTGEQVLLLRAATGTPDQTREAWADWRAGLGDLDRLDDGAMRLAPQLHGALRAAGVDDPDLPRLKGALRHAWSRNQALTARLVPALTALHDAGIPTMALKGAALAALHYRHPGERPMWDADVLVPAGRRDAALAVLRDGGWTPETGDRTALVWAHAIGFEHASGGRLDLHWYARHEPADDPPLWEASVPLELHGVTTRAPAPADLLLLVCVHARRFHPAPLVHWAADAMAILRGGVDWDRLVARAIATNLTLGPADALAELRDLVGAPVPDGVLAALRAAPVPARTRAAYRAGLRPWSTAAKLVVLHDHWHRLRALDAPHMPAPAYPDWVAAACGQPSRRALARWAIAWPRRAHLPSA